MIDKREFSSELGSCVRERIQVGCELLTVSNSCVLNFWSAIKFHCEIEPTSTLQYALTDPHEMSAATKSVSLTYAMAQQNTASE
jgi:hypothetical protein